MLTRHLLVALIMIIAQPTSKSYSAGVSSQFGNLTLATIKELLGSLPNDIGDECPELENVCSTENSNRTVCLKFDDDVKCPKSAFEVQGHAMFGCDARSPDWKDVCKCTIDDQGYLIGQDGKIVVLRSQVIYSRFFDERFKRWTDKQAKITRVFEKNLLASLTALENRIPLNQQQDFGSTNGFFPQLSDPTSSPIACFNRRPEEERLLQVLKGGLLANFAVVWLTLSLGITILFYSLVWVYRSLTGSVSILSVLICFDAKITFYSLSGWSIWSLRRLPFTRDFHSLARRRAPSFDRNMLWNLPLACPTPVLVLWLWQNETSRLYFRSTEGYHYFYSRFSVGFNH